MDNGQVFKHNIHTHAQRVCILMHVVCVYRAHWHGIFDWKSNVFLFSLLNFRYAMHTQCAGTLVLAPIAASQLCRKLHEVGLARYGTTKYHPNNARRDRHAQHL